MNKEKTRRGGMVLGVIVASSLALYTVRRMDDLAPVYFAYGLCELNRRAVATLNTGIVYYPPGSDCYNVRCIAATPSCGLNTETGVFEDKVDSRISKSAVNILRNPIIALRGVQVSSP